MKVIRNELLENVFNYDVILVGMGINNSFKGFASEVRYSFPNVYQEELRVSNYSDTNKCGTILPIEDSGITFCMCYIHKGNYAKKYRGACFLNYGNLKSCLLAVKKEYRGKKIGTPLLGASPYDGNGDKEKVLEIFNEVFSDFDIDVYDYEQKDYARMIFREIASLHKRSEEHTITPQEYTEKRSEIEWRRKNGIFKPMPEGYEYFPKQNKKPLFVTKKDLGIEKPKKLEKKKKKK
jgi:hypothetical protein